MTALSLRLGARLHGLAGGLLRRFPECVAVSVLATALGLAAVNGAIPAAWEGLAFTFGIWCAATGPFLAGLRLLAEGRDWPAGPHGAAGLGGALLLALWAWAGHDLDAEHWFATFRFLLPAAALIWALLLAPGLARRPGDAASLYWHGVRRALGALAAAALTVLVLAAGLSAAIAGLDALLDLPVPEELFADLWLVSGLLLLPCSWLAVLPPAGEAAPSAVPRALALAIELVLVPLALIYMAILYAYLALAVLRWSLPEGTTAGLVAAYATAGTAIWLIAAAPDHPGGRHVRLFRRLFFPALLPPLAMLAVALWIRVADYGVTEPRYLLGLLALWMFGAALVAFLPRSSLGRGRLAAAPGLLCLLLALATFGPWSAASVSLASQMDRLRADLTAAGLLRDGAVVAAGSLGTAPPFALRQRISGILDYLAESGRMDALRPWLPDDAGLAPDARAEDAARALGIAYAPTYGNADAARHVSLWGGSLRPMTITGYAGLMPFDLTAREDGPSGDAALLLGGRRYRLFVAAAPPALDLTDSDGRRIRFALDGVMDRLDRSDGSAQTPHIVEGADRGLRARLVLQTLSGTIAATGPVLQQAGGLLLLAPAAAE